MIDFMFSLVLGGAFIALLYGVIVMFARWREAWRLRADFDPLLGYELHPRIERFMAAPDFPPSDPTDASGKFTGGYVRSGPILVGSGNPRAMQCNSAALDPAQQVSPSSNVPTPVEYFPAQYVNQATQPEKHIESF